MYAYIRPLSAGFSADKKNIFSLGENVFCGGELTDSVNLDGDAVSLELVWRLKYCGGGPGRR